jgi:hypothetical protein
MLRELCRCGCEKDRHYSEYVSTGDVTNPGSSEPQYFACLIMHCPCAKYTPLPIKKKD